MSASRLALLMAKRKAERKAQSATTPKPTPKPVPKPTPKVIVEPKEIATPTEDAATKVESEVKAATSFIAPPKTTVGSLNEISTQITEALSDAEQKVADQREAGVYDLSERATEIMGADAEHLVSTMQQLDAALVEKSPEIRTLSREIRKNLEQYPELTHILTDEQLHIMVQGYLTLANVKTAPKTKAGKTAAANKKSAAVLKAAANKSLDALF